MSVRAWARRLYYDRWLVWRHERRFRYLGHAGALAAWLRNRNARYRLLTDAAVRERKRCDTVFVFGSGPSIGRLSAAQWAVIREHDSFGINFSFLLDHAPTFHVMEDPKTVDGRRTLREVLAPRRPALSGTVWAMPRKQLGRLLHPRYAPEFFPLDPLVWPYEPAPTIRLERDRAFTAEDFTRAITYRGTMSVALELAFRLGYVRIVLLGVDLHTHGHFYDAIPAMRYFVERARSRYDVPLQGGDFRVFPTMVPMAGKYRPFDDYLYALKELYCDPRGIELYVGNADNMLCPKIPCFEGW